MRLLAHEVIAPDMVRTSRLKGRLCPNQSRYEEIKIGRVYVADCNDAQIGCGGGVDGESCASSRQRSEDGDVCPLSEEDGDLVFVDGKEKQGCRLAVEVGEVPAFKSGVGGQSFRIGQVKAEGKTALEPGFDGVAVRRDDLWDGSAGERGEVLVEKFGIERVGLMELAQPRSDTASRMAAAMAAQAMGRKE